MEVKRGYHQSEAGVIPDDWTAWELQDACERITVGLATSVTKHYRPSGVPIIRNLNIREGFFDGEDILFVSQEFARLNATKSARAFDVLTVRTGASLGNACVLPSSLDHCQTFTTLITTPKKEVLCPEFLCLHMISLLGKKEMNRLQAGGAKGNLNTGELRHYQIAIPPQSEQKAIVEALKDADKAVKCLEDLLAKNRQLREAAMQALLTGAKRLPGFNGKWQTRRIGDVAFPSTERNTAGEPWTVLTCSKHLGFVESLKYFKSRVYSKDTTGYKVIRRGQIGYPANHIEEGSIGLQDLCDVALVSPIYVVFSVNEQVDSYFLHRLLKLESYRRRFATATSASVDRRGSLRWPTFSEITVSLPSFEEQSSIRTVLSDLDAEIAALEARLEKVLQLKQGMMQELLTGRIRLV